MILWIRYEKGREYTDDSRKAFSKQVWKYKSKEAMNQVSVFATTNYHLPDVQTGYLKDAGKHNFYNL